MTVSEVKQATNITVIYHREIIGDKKSAAISGMISTAESSSRVAITRAGPRLNG
jgi:hypothetical protein